ncbi:MAG: M48 family metallopeptidase [Bacteroidetes bacterium]|nr:M48 family metallopeptidase [Bacteroidota bacterium]MBU1719361.1 M48 family metallopeptidase [Bacteroidota bacterium]
MNKLLTALFIFLVSYGFGQKYSGPVSQAPVPDDFTRQFSDKFYNELSTDGQASTRKEKATKTQFLLESNYYSDQLMQSGKICFNDSISTYLNDIADVLLRDKPELRQKLRIYCAKYPSVNAFSNNSGILIFNIGLIAQVENEAQLAFVLAHEIIHFVKKHSLNIYLEKTSKSERKRIADLRGAEKYLAYNARNKDAEFEADMSGFKDIYVNTNYDLSEVIRFFKVLLYSDLPMDDIAVSKSFFEQPGYFLPDEYFLEKTNPVLSEEDYDDTKSTHPNIKKRRDALEAEIERLDNSGKHKFIISEERFLRVREIARKEVVRQQMLHLEYGEAIYNSYSMMKANPNESFYEITVAKAFYYLAKYRIGGKYYDVTDSPGKIQGESQQVHHFLREAGSKTISTLAMTRLWNTMRKYPDDAHLKLLVDNLFKDLVFEQEFVPKDFKKNDVLSELESRSEQESADTLKPQSKYDRIEKKKGAVTADEYYKYGFSALLDDEAFVHQFDSLVLEKEKKDSIEALPKVKKKKKQLRLEAELAKKPGIDHVMMINPFYLNISYKKNQPIKYLNLEKMDQEFTNLLGIYGQREGVKIEMFDAKSDDSQSADWYNDYCALRELLLEIISHESMDMIPYQSSAVSRLAAENGTKFFCWPILVTEAHTDFMNDYNLCIVSMIVWPLLPYAIVKCFIPNYSSRFYLLVFDVNNCQIEMSAGDSYNTNSSVSRMRSWILKAYNEMKTPR